MTRARAVLGNLLTSIGERVASRLAGHYSRPLMKQFSGVPRKDLQWKRMPTDALGLKGKKVAVVGGTGGIGRALVQHMAANGATVTVVGQTFRDPPSPNVSFLKADLGLMREAQRIARTLAAEELDVVVLSVGIIAASKREETREGLERDMAVSFLSRVAILRELAPRLSERSRKTGVRPRVFIFGFPGTAQKGATDDLNAERSYAAMDVHMNTVAGNEALVLEAAHRYPDVAFFGLNPGLIQTNIRSNLLGEGSFRHRAAETLIGLLTPSAEKYAERLTPLLFAPELERSSGAMFNQKGTAILRSPSHTPEHVAQFIQKSEALVDRGLAAPLRDDKAN